MSGPISEFRDLYSRVVAHYYAAFGAVLSFKDFNSFINTSFMNRVNKLILGIHAIKNGPVGKDDKLSELYKTKISPCLEELGRVGLAEKITLAHNILIIEGYEEPEDRASTDKAFSDKSLEVVKFDELVTGCSANIAELNSKLVCTESAVRRSKLEDKIKRKQHELNRLKAGLKLKQKEYRICDLLRCSAHNFPIFNDGDPLNFLLNRDFFDASIKQKPTKQQRILYAMILSVNADRAAKGGIGLTLSEPYINLCTVMADNERPSIKTEGEAKGRAEVLAVLEEIISFIADFRQKIVDFDSLGKFLLTLCNSKTNECEAIAELEKSKPQIKVYLDELDDDSKINMKKLLTKLSLYFYKTYQPYKIVPSHRTSVSSSIGDSSVDTSPTNYSVSTATKILSAASEPLPHNQGPSVCVGGAGAASAPAGSSSTDTFSTDTPSTDTFSTDTSSTDTPPASNVKSSILQFPFFLLKSALGSSGRSDDNPSSIAQKSN